MLSKPSLESSPGSSAAASTGRSSRSRTALAYSVRLRRWSAGAPGSGLRAAAASSACLQCRRQSDRACRRPAGARRPAASCRPAACERLFPRSPAARRRATSGSSSSRPPARTRRCGSVTQYRSSSAFWPAASRQSPADPRAPVEWTEPQCRRVAGSTASSDAAIGLPARAHVLRLTRGLSTLAHRATVNTEPQHANHSASCVASVVDGEAARLLLRRQFFEQRHRRGLAFGADGGEEDALGPSHRRPALAILDVQACAVLDEKPDDVVRASVGRADAAPSTPSSWSALTSAPSSRQSATAWSCAAFDSV